MLWNGDRVPFTLLGGYLGAGKTTIVNRLVRRRDGRRLVVLVNDIGAVNVDAALIADHDGETLSLTNGCVCCTIADDFGQTLERIRAMTDPPDQIVMELSGVAEPARVAPWANTTGFRLDGIVVAIDAEQICDQIDRDYVGDTVRAQLSAADLVVLTKTDLVSDGGAAARGVIRGHSNAPILPSDASFDPGVVFGVTRPGVAPPTGQHLAGHRTSLVDLRSSTRAELVRAVAGLPADVIRAKGLVRCTDREVAVEVQVVGGRRTVTDRPEIDIGLATGQVVVIRAMTT